MLTYNLYHTPFVTRSDWLRPYAESVRPRHLSGPITDDVADKAIVVIPAGTGSGDVSRRGIRSRIRASHIQDVQKPAYLIFASPALFQPIRELAFDLP